MKIKQNIKMLALSLTMLVPSLSGASVVLPALDIQNMSGDSGVSIVGGLLEIDATAFSIVTDADPIDIVDESFSLSGFGFLAGGLGMFSGDFAVGSLLEGSFSNLTLLQYSATSGQFAGDVIFEGGSLMGSLTTGTFEGVYSSGGLVAKLGAVSIGLGDNLTTEVTAVPVPAAVWLFGSGLIGVVGLARRKA